MSKRKCVNRTEQEKIELLKEWRDNPSWDIHEASRRLKVKEPTLRGWKKLYWHRLDSIEGSKRKRKKGNGPGPRRKLKPYEDRVVDYFVSLREEGKCRFGDMLFYCQNIDNFMRDFPELSGQKSWVDRFIKYYSKQLDSQDGEVPGGVKTHSGGDGANSGDGGANLDGVDGDRANLDGGGVNSSGGDGDGANSDGGGANSGGGGGNSDDSGANADGGGGNAESGGVNSSGGDGDGANSYSDGANSGCDGSKSDKGAPKLDIRGANTDGDRDKSDSGANKGGHGRKDRVRAARSGGNAAQNARVDDSDENGDHSVDESVPGEVPIARRKGAGAAHNVNELSGHDDFLFGGTGNVSSDESAASSGCASDSDDSLFEIDTHEKKAPACPKKQIFFRKPHLCAVKAFA
ncbi:hypothetical protein PHYSODRAFT_326763 [Phytophthora sojae]|uniref:Uncharacterized protein n=1 Tax=Phytophthora sojae (strain P6497) TaxID=1094619 RepID=G4YZL6_PHYSP|nr:hypothetical protein PHYSODRAFT_326763 [Phytophthora sojae]EGZ25784.1 hypothetical protein PHYSODRAFT_326763 [Phytophthora sojae]|eukprot:XP_009521072.1 hypothetical protein PHYSODRAFT_326763 [Phytophthora sojae]